MYRWFWASTLHGVSSLLSHVIMISPVPLCVHHVCFSKIMSSPIVSRIDSVWKFLPRWAMSSSTLEFEKVLFHSEHPIELMDQEYWVWSTTQGESWSTVWFYNGARSLKHGRNSRMANREVSFFQRSQHPPPRSMHLSLFIVTLLCKSRGEISFKGEDCNTPCYFFP
jgi:hypothetical protein